MRTLMRIKATPILLALSAAWASARAQTVEAPVWKAVGTGDRAGYFALETLRPLGPEGVEAATAVAWCRECPQVFVSQEAGPNGGAVVVGRFHGVAPKSVRVLLTWGVAD